MGMDVDTVEMGGRMVARGRHLAVDGGGGEGKDAETDFSFSTWLLSELRSAARLLARTHCHSVLVSE